MKCLIILTLSALRSNYRFNGSALISAHRPAGGVDVESNDFISVADDFIAAAISLVC